MFFMDLLILILQALKILEDDMAYGIINVRRMVVGSKVYLSSHMLMMMILQQALCVNFTKTFIFSGEFSNKKDSFFGS